LKILHKDQIQNNKIILLQGENGRTLIKNKLKKEGFNICLIECYKRVLKVLDANIEVKKWRSSKINTLVVTSGETLYQLKIVLSNVNQIEWLLKCKLFVVGERLSKIARNLGWKDIIVSNYANNKCFFETIKKIYFKN